MLAGVNFGAKQITPKLGGMCWHRFLTCANEGDFGEGKMADSKETKRCTELESADGSPSDGLGEYSAKMLIRQLWCSADGKVADEVKEGEKDPDSTKILMIRL